MKKTLSSLLVLTAAVISVPAQLPGLGGGLPTTAPGADFATFAQIFGKTANFTARSEVRVLDKNQKETISTAMDFAMLDNKLRLEIDATATKNKDVPPEATAGLKQMGMDQVQVIMRPDRQSVYFVFPKAAMHINMPMEKSDLDAAAKATVKTEALGKETLDGHPCVKNKVTITSAKGEPQELTVWNATDLKNLPIQTVQKQGEDTIVTRYSRIQPGKADAKQFEPPTGSEEFKGMAEFMQGMMKKALGGGLPPGQ